MGVLALTPGPAPKMGSRADRTCGQIRRLRRWDARVDPHPRPLNPKWERGDSGVRVWHPIAVHGHDEHLFGPPLNPKWERGDSGARVWHPIAVHSYYEHLFCPPLNPVAWCPNPGPRCPNSSSHRCSSRKPYPMPICKNLPPKDTAGLFMPGAALRFVGRHRSRNRVSCALSQQVRSPQTFSVKMVAPPLGGYRLFERRALMRNKPVVSLKARWRGWPRPRVRGAQPRVVRRTPRAVVASAASIGLHLPDVY
jgi:hypothetical protein